MCFGGNYYKPSELYGANFFWSANEGKIPKISFLFPNLKHSHIYFDTLEYIKNSIRTNTSQLIS